MLNAECYCCCCQVLPAAIAQAPAVTRHTTPVVIPNLDKNGYLRTNQPGASFCTLLTSLGVAQLAGVESLSRAARKTRSKN
jgi:hypothetical protein